MQRPLETGWLTDTPETDTVIRSFTLDQATLDAEIAHACGGRTDRDDDVAIADTGGLVAYFNQAVLLRPLRGLDDPVLARIDSFFAASAGRPRTLLSVWPTPDLRHAGWSLIGHPAFVIRPPGPATHTPAPGVEVEQVRSPDRLQVVERIAIDGYPIDDLKEAPPGTAMPPAVLNTPLSCRLGLLDSEPVAVGLRHSSHGVLNLCLGATLPKARRRGVWEALVWARLGDAPDLPAVAYTSDYSRPGFLRMGFLPATRFTLWGAA